MHTTNLRKVGGSVMLALPPVILALLHLNVGAKVGLSVDNGRLVIEPRPRYILADLLADCDASADLSPEDQEWVETKPVGSELL